ncbi:MAG: LLM class flavin-dependent oxidoreductase [Alphaproteobacteria bacterium]
MDLGLFLMPLHDPLGDLPGLLKEDRDCIILADQLGFREAWVGEHYCSRSEPIPDPLQFMASLLSDTKQIRLGPAVLNLPQHHPVQVAANAALFDHLSNGRFNMGVGPGGLQSDMEMFRTRDIDRQAAMLESMQIIRMLWTTEPPYKFKGKFWDISLEKTLDMKMGIGPVIRPFQKPTPPIAVSAMSPNSKTAEAAGANGWGLISANFMPTSTARTHWEVYSKAAAAAGHKPDRANWRLARSILVTESAAEAEVYLSRPQTSVRWYFEYLHHSFAAKNILGVFKRSPDVPDEDVRVDRLLRDLVIIGDARYVIDRLIAIIDEIGPFGGLLLAKKDWDDPPLHKRSYRLMAEQVMPVVRKYVSGLSGRVAAAA